MFSIEEFPPSPRKPVTVEKPARERRDFGGAVMAAPLLLGLAAGLGGGWWMARRVSAVEVELAEARETLEEAGNSLRLLWSTTTRLDSTQMARQDVLQDSIGFVRSYVEAEVDRLWQTAYLEHEQRLDQTARRLTGNDRSIRQLADAAGTTNTRLEALIGQNRALQSDLRAVGETAAALQQTLSGLTGQLASLQADLSAYGNIQGRLASRVDGVEKWVSPYREQGLTAESLNGRISTLASDLRRVSIRVDSLRTAARTAGTVPQRP